MFWTGTILFNNIQLVLGLHKVWSNAFSMVLLKVPVVLENLLVTLNIMLNSVNPGGAILVRTKSITVLLLLFF